MELLRRDKGPNFGHMVAYYNGSDEVWSSMLVFSDVVKNGDTASTTTCTKLAPQSMVV